MTDAVPPPGPPAPPEQNPGLLGITARTLVWRLVSSASAAALVILTATRLRPAGRGTFVLFLTLASLTVLFCGLGITVSARMHLVSATAPVLLSEYLGLAAALVVLQVVVGLLVGGLLLPLADVRLSGRDLALFGALGGTLLLGYLMQTALNAFGHTAHASAAEAAGSLVQLLLAVSLSLADVSAVQPYVGALMVGNVAQVFIVLTVLARKRDGPLRLSYHRSHWRVLIRTGLRAIGLDVSQAFAFRIDRYIVGVVMDPTAVGIYSIAATVPELLRMPIIAFVQPLFHRLASRSSGLEQARRTRTRCLGVTALLVVPSFIAAPFAIEALLGTDYLGAVTPLRILLLGEFGITLLYINAAFLAGGLNRVKDASRAATAGLIALVVGDLVLIPRYGLGGAAWASVIGYTVMGLTAERLFSRRRHET